MSGECDKCSEHALECQCNIHPWFKLPHSDRLAIAEFFFQSITQEPTCSFRRFIYNRLGFTPQDYAPLYLAGGMIITNAMCDSEHLDHQCCRR